MSDDAAIRTQLVIVGAGPGGYAAAFMAADLGIEVTLVELDANPGGVCLYRGCIPSKSLLHIAKLLTESRDASAWGVEFQPPRIDLDRVRTWKEGIIDRMARNLGELAKRRNIRYVRGRASFTGPDALRVVADDGRESALTFQHAIIATGSRPALLPHVTLDSPRLMNSTDALAVRDIPPSLLVVGSGYNGMELGSIYAALGSRVTMVESAPQLLPGSDRDLAEILLSSVKTRFAAAHPGTTVTALAESSDGLQATLRGPDGATRTETFAKVLVAIGRKPNTSGLGLDVAGVKTDEHGFIVVNGERRTNTPHILAIGDVTGGPMLAHKASHEGRIAAEIVAGHRVSFEPRAIPAVVYTDPEISWCGLTEQEAEARGIPIKVTRFPWGASSRAATMDRPIGLTKLIVDPATEQVLGMGIAGSGAGELIAEGVLAIEMGARASDIRLSIHPHPTLSETVMESAEMYFGTAAHVYRPATPPPGA